ncbi:PAT family beta-lactamase induction signal transducer AmpG [Paucimonas lemoignei]|uniref:PAT family beta-lactamase induction signal transducer AmpG n=1 Tax=Paucimonas lemoignei TaxID=29443 RepID=A0A4R3HXJ7_PAULE|nr:MFS transporter [Paucimonas lemoignei]TCS37888.1 PAT family beta-lactamase induction signal transducer AmpG [Paucimonas lemoignei]
MSQTPGSAPHRHDTDNSKDQGAARAGEEKARSGTRIRDAFLQPSAWTMFFFGFASGLPFLLVAGTLAYWLKEGGIVLKDITMIASAGLAYSFKFLWAPLVDRLRLPILGRLGQRRSWLLLAQVAVMIGLAAMASVTPEQLPLFVGLTLLVAFAGATLDIVVDAYRIEIAPVEAQGALVATYSLGYRIALIITGAVALVLADHFIWPNVYRLMALFMLIPIATNLLAREPEVIRLHAKSWVAGMREGVVEPFADFFRRFGGRVGLVILLFILLFKISDQALVGGIMGPFYLDQGFTKTQIATISKIYGIWVGIGGAFLGGVAVVRLGVERALLLSIVLGALSNLLYLGLIGANGNVGMLTLVISGENLAQGLLGTTAVAYLSALVNQRYTATQYALFSSLITLPGKVLGFYSGRIVEAVGYAPYFWITTLAIVPAVALYFWLRPRVRLDGEAGAVERDN